jgi:hypothetical protein
MTKVYIPNEEVYVGLDVRKNFWGLYVRNPVPPQDPKD